MKFVKPIPKFAATAFTGSSSAGRFALPTSRPRLSTSSIRFDTSPVRPTFPTRPTQSSLLFSTITTGFLTRIHIPSTAP